MPLFNIFLPLGVFVVTSDCLPVGNSTAPSQRREHKFKFPPNSSTTTDRLQLPAWSKDRTNTSRIVAGLEHFVFPHDDSPPIAARFKPVSSKRSPTCAKGTTFCEEIDDYPGSYLENVFQNAVDEFHELLGTDELNSTSLWQRFDSNLNETPLCASEEQIVFPKTAKTKEDKWLYVVNQASYVQGVRIEKCLRNYDDPTQSCFFTESFPIGYKATCKQKYIYRKLVALNEEGKPVTDTFQLPSCCSCTVISNGLSSRHRAAFKKPIISTTISSTSVKP